MNDCAYNYLPTVEILIQMHMEMFLLKLTQRKAQFVHIDHRWAGKICPCFSITIQVQTNRICNDQNIFCINEI